MVLLSFLLLNTFQRQSRRNYANAEFSSAEGSRAHKPRSFADLTSSLPVSRVKPSAEAGNAVRFNRFRCRLPVAENRSNRHRTNLRPKPKESDSRSLRRKFNALLATHSKPLCGFALNKPKIFLEFAPELGLASQCQTDPCINSAIYAKLLHIDGKGDGIIY